MTKALERYARQIRFGPLGEEGQRRLASSRVLICGCGALGSHIADHLARAGVGFLRIVDRDFVDLTNLQRQVLFDEDDVAGNLPKAIAAAGKLVRINSQIRIEPVVADVDFRNVGDLCRDVEMFVDGTDNFETRYLLNDVAVSLGKPWVYGGCIGADGQVMTILPGDTACLSCLVPEIPPAGALPTCDTAGVMGPAVGVIASLEAMEALKILSGHREAINRSLYVVQLWENQIRQIDLAGLRERSDCRTCKQHDFRWLEGRQGSHSAVLCGRNAVQLSPPSSGQRQSLDSLAERLAGVGRVVCNPYLVRLDADAYQITVFSDGRAIVSGTDDVATARTVYARYIGH